MWLLIHAVIKLTFKNDCHDNMESHVMVSIKFVCSRCELDLFLKTQLNAKHQDTSHYFLTRKITEITQIILAKNIQALILHDDIFVLPKNAIQSLWLFWG